MAIPAATGQLKIGKMYMVPCLRISMKRSPNFARRGDWIPVLLPEHDDPEIGANFKHYHLDFRFLTAWQLRRADYGSVLAQPAGFQYGFNNPMFFEPGVVYQQMRCKREMPPYPHCRPRWIPLLCAKYQNARLINFKCPHKGIDLSGCPIVDGVVTCPGHGLRWNVETGKMADIQ